MDKLFNYFVATNLYFTENYIFEHPIIFFMFHVILYGYGLTFGVYSILRFIGFILAFYYEEFNKSAFKLRLSDFLANLRT